MKLERLGKNCGRGTKPQIYGGIINGKENERKPEEEQMKVECCKKRI